MAAASAEQDLLNLPPEFLAVDIHQKLMDASIAFIILSTLTYALFNISRITCAERNGWETWTVYPFSYICSLALSILGILKPGGAGRHGAYWLLHDPGVIESFLKVDTATEFVYMAGVTFPKVCILLLYLYIFVDRTVRIITKVVLGVVLTNFVATGIIATFTICQPFAFKWDKSIPNGHCTDLMAGYRYISIPNIFTDLAILSLPISTLYRLQISRIRKIGIFLTLMAGGLGIVTAIVRFVGFYMVDLFSDPTYLGIDTQVYTIIEPNAYFICSCLPGIRPLMRQLYRNSGLGHTIRKVYHGINSSSSSGARQGRDIALGNYQGNHKAAATASNGLQLSSSDDDNGHSIRLEETIRVEYSSTHTSERDLV
ncbi:hypothetical protein GGR53DRAFT_531687 [Hypoxylon sp. FL1150]|nr:hypothetical protein GGR53DRAFT_531687 [Hypoxylon sp. FL1150]